MPENTDSNNAHTGFTIIPKNDVREPITPPENIKNPEQTYTQQNIVKDNCEGQRDCVYQIDKATRC